MSVTLSELETATSAYLRDQVETRVARVTGNLDPGDDGTFTVRVTNAADPDGLHLVDMYVHVSTSDPSIATLEVPGSALLIPRGSNDSNGPRLTSGDQVDEMFVFFHDPFQPGVIDSALDPAETTEFEVGYHAVGAGSAEFSAHVHARIDLDRLFPIATGQNGVKPVVIRN